MDNVLAQLIVAAIAAASGVFGSYVVRKSSQESNGTDRYKAVLHGMEQVMESRLALRDEKIADLQDVTETLRENIEKLKADLHDTTTRYRAAVSHVIELRATHPAPPDPPAPIRDEIV